MTSRPRPPPILHPPTMRPKYSQVRTSKRGTFYRRASYTFSFPGRYHEVNPGQYHEVNPGQYHEVNPGQYHEVNPGQYHEVNPGQYVPDENLEVEVEVERAGPDKRVYNVQSRVDEFIIGEYGYVLT